VDKIQRKRQELDDVWTQIQAWQDALEAYRDRHDDDQEIDRGIRARLEQIADELENVERKTRGRRPISYEELKNQLDQIKSRARTAVPYGSGSISVNDIESWNNRNRRRRRWW
jgi:hypothetical protein